MPGITYDEPVDIGEGWEIVAYDPTALHYHDEDAEAMDLSNWAYLRGGLDDDNESAWETTGERYYGAPVVLPDLSTGDWIIARADELDEGWSQPDRPYTFSTHVLAVRSESDAAEWVAACRDALAEYPLLDESDYCERDYAAWERCWGDWAARDVARAAAELIAADRQGVDVSDLADAIDDHRDEWDRAAHEGMSYFYGLTGEFDEDGAAVAVAAWWRGALAEVGIVARVLRDANRAACGVRPLPFPA